MGKERYDYKDWKEFRATGLFWWINMILHTFGWVLVYDPDKNEVLPARTNVRGFEAERNDKGYKQVAQYIKNNAEEILKECDE